MLRRCVVDALAGWLGLATLALAVPACAATVVDPLQGPVALAPGSFGAHELSGIAHAGAGLYYAVSDSGAELFSIEIEIDGASGEILDADVTAALTLGAGVDLEGVVVHPLGGSVFASDEGGPAIREYRLSDGVVLSNVAVPAVFADARNNFSLESLTLRVAPDASDDALWSANEEALGVDGPLSTGSTGSVVRLQRFDANLAPDGQWAYVTDPFPGAPFLGQERSGVADLLALPNGELLVLERSFSTALFRSRLYQVDFAGATDTSALPGLAGAAYTPVAKTLLWERSGGTQNYEGLALGPQLDAGDWSVLLVSDDGGGAAQALHSLRLGFVPEPGRLAQLASGVAFLGLLSMGRSRERLPPRRRR